MRLFWIVILSWLGLQSAFANEFWQKASEPNHFILMRHALAPGGGDPANFNVKDCSTQRNLNEVGRQQARKIGQAFKDNGIAAARVFTSQWCRCKETAELLALGEVEELPSLNSFFSDRDKGPAQLAELTSDLEAMGGNGPVVLVTHQVVITGLTGVFPASGEMVLVRQTDNGFEVVARLAL